MESRIVHSCTYTYIYTYHSHTPTPSDTLSNTSFKCTSQCKHTRKFQRETYSCQNHHPLLPLMSLSEIHLLLKEFISTIFNVRIVSQIVSQNSYQNSLVCLPPRPNWLIQSILYFSHKRHACHLVACKLHKCQTVFVSQLLQNNHDFWFDCKFWDPRFHWMQKIIYNN